MHAEWFNTLMYLETCTLMPYLKLHALSFSCFRVFFKRERETKFLQENNSIHDRKTMHITKMEHSK
jgi:hypothetical protein